MVVWSEKYRSFAFQIQVTDPKVLNYGLFGKYCLMSMKMSPHYTHKDFNKSPGSFHQALESNL